MDINFIGRVQNTTLSGSNSLLPIFEAIVNSIHAIEESGISDGKIVLTIERDEQAELPSLNDTRPIKNIEIIDNGIGFTDENYQSFRTSDTTKKASKGAKGIGRFLWLKAFEKVEVKSIFYQNDSCYRRKFDFLLNREGINNHTFDEDNSDKIRETSVKLFNFKQPYQSHCPKSSEVIAFKIIEHILVWFLYKKQPFIQIIDNNTILDLTKLFNEKIQTTSAFNEFSVKSENFRIDHLKIYHGATQKHQTHYCANNREVESIALMSDIKDLSNKLKDEQDRYFTYSGYISGKFLDKHVNPERTNFNIQEKRESVFGEITKEEIKNASIPYVEEYLSSYLTPLRKIKREKIEKYIFSNSPQFRPLLKYKPEYLKLLPPNLEGDKLHIELSKVYYKAEIETRETIQYLIGEKNIDKDNLEEFKEKFVKCIDQVNDFGKANLAQYIVHRRLILELFEKLLSKNNESKKYSLEETIHRIIFPLKKTSDEITHEQQNLWIIDERLCYHKYLASDKLLKHIEEIENQSDLRPDLLIFNSPFAFVEGNPPFNSIVIIEFKRPVRMNYTDDDNPIEQVIRYAKKITDGKILDKNGRPISISPKFPFYAYILCDLTEKIRQYAEEKDCTPSPDNLGYFYYHKNYSIYIEIISYDKLVSDAKKRNQVLFEKLSVPL